MTVVGETDECNIFGNTKPHLLDGSEGGKGDDIVECENGVRAVVTTEQSLGCIERHLIVYLAASHHLAVDGNAMLPQRLKISMLAPAHHVEMIGPADEGNPLASCLNEMIGCHLCGFVAIGSDRRKLVGETCATEEDERNTH